VGIVRDPWEGETGEERSGKTAPKERWTVISHLVDTENKRVYGVDMFDRLLKEGECLHYAQKHELEADGVGYLVDEYIREKCNVRPWTDDLTAEEGRDDDKWSDGNKKETKDKCAHKDYAEGIAYRTEVHAGYAGGACYLAGLSCGDCGKAFSDNRQTHTPTKGSGISGTSTFRPTPSAPVYFCVNLNQYRENTPGNEETGECTHALCSACFREGALAWSTKTSGRLQRNQKA
jgi:hypothetical protein